MLSKMIEEEREEFKQKEEEERDRRDEEFEKTLERLFCKDS